MSNIKSAAAKKIDTYISRSPKDVAGKLNAIRKVIKKHAPDIVGVISYGMPAFKLNNRIVVYFALHKNHIGLYPYPSVLLAFKKDSAKYKTGRGSIQFPLDQKLAITLISKIVTYRVKEVVIKAKRK